MDTSTVIAIAAAVIATGLSITLLLRTRRLARAVDDARARIGGPPPSRRWRRTGALDDALRSLERSSGQAQRERSQLAGAVQAAAIGIVVTDDHGTVVFANQAADQLLGIREGEVISDDRLRVAIERAVLDRNSTVAELELFVPSRSVLEVVAIPLDFGVESVGAVGYITEVTEARRVEAVRRDFVANVGHELKAPLSALAALAGTLGENLGDAKVARRLAGQLDEEASRLSALLENILDLSQAEALSSHQEPVQATSLIASVAEAMAPIADQKGIELVVEAVPPAARISGDRRHLRSMLVNLIDNAIKFSEPSKQDSTPTVRLRTTIRDDQVVFEVQDQGIGIPDDEIERVFERFYRVDRARSRASGGTGLGLSIVRHVARNHGGGVDVESTPGEGSTFTVSLPLWRNR